MIAPAALGRIGVEHAAWAAGSSWPFADRTRLAHAIDGVGAEDFPGPAGDIPPFARLNTTVYSPLCLVLGARWAARGVP